MNKKQIKAQLKVIEAKAIANLKAEKEKQLIKMVKEATDIMSLDVETSNIKEELESMSQLLGTLYKVITANTKHTGLTFDFYNMRYLRAKLNELRDMLDTKNPGQDYAIHFHSPWGKSDTSVFDTEWQGKEQELRKAFRDIHANILNMNAAETLDYLERVGITLSEDELEANKPVTALMVPVDLSGLMQYIVK